MSANWVKITNIYPGDCIRLTAGVQVDYSNATIPAGKVGLGCGGAPSPADQGAPPGTNGTLSFTITHGAASAGHTLTATLRGGGMSVGDSVSPVHVGNPCPLKISGADEFVDGFISLDPKKDLAGTFEANHGNRIDLMLEDPGELVEGKLPAPRLLYLDRAMVSVDKQEGLWKHAALPGARKGLLLRVVLSKDGQVVSTIRAKFV